MQTIGTWARIAVWNQRGQDHLRSPIPPMMAKIDRVSDNAKEVDAFSQLLIPALSPAAAFQAPRQLGGHYVVAMSHLDARSTAAGLIRDTVERLLAEVAEELSDGWVWADGPGAGISKASADQWKTVAEQLRGLHLTIEPPAETGADIAGRCPRLGRTPAALTQWPCARSHGITATGARSAW